MPDESDRETHFQPSIRGSFVTGVVKCEPQGEERGITIIDDSRKNGQ